MQQDFMLSLYNQTNKIPFNDDLFSRSDKDLLDAFMIQLKSCEQDTQYFSLKIEKFEVHRRYSEIMEILREEEQDVIDYKKSKKSKKRASDLINKYDMIPTTNSAFMMLTVHYHIKLKTNKESKRQQITEDRFFNRILLPRIVDKYYYLINGNYYSAIYQLIDASTYNNSVYQNVKTHNVTFRNLFLPLVISEKFKELKTVDGQSVRSTIYSTLAFNTSVYSMVYMFAKFGFIETIQFFGLHPGQIVLHNSIPDTELYSNHYIFHPNPKKDIYISVPKQIFNLSNPFQSLVATLYYYIEESKFKATRQDVYKIEFWMQCMTSRYSSSNITRDMYLEKANSILDSYESLLDDLTRNTLNLPDDQKADIYCITRWIINEFNILRKRSILDVTYKRLRREEHIASLYISKLANAIYRSVNHKGSITITNIKRYMKTKPDYLFNVLTKDNKLILFKNNSNDADYINALKYTIKGVSGIGHNKKAAIADIFRHLDKSKMGIFDPDTSSNSDPGLTGMLCPMADLYENGYIAEYEEPNGWMEQYNQIYNEYLQTLQRRNCLIFEDEQEDKDVLDSVIQIQENALSLMQSANSTDEEMYNGMILN